ncbi:MAG: DUF512 domain-containing protein [Negativicutes bacterium]|nr:DUF512 domain-containing protein [Negativicutes bacterium]
MAHPTIKKILSPSPAAGSPLQPGWQLLRINQKEIGDILDYQIAIADASLVTEWLDLTGARVTHTFEKPIDKDLGIEFTTLTLDKPKVCLNHCQFCFVDQLPRGMRGSLYYKDDDYRLSFLSGSYITLCNTSWADLQRISSLKLSPLFISVHAWDLQQRQALLCNQDHEFRQKFLYLVNQGIRLHCQIVICPGLNDGAILRDTCTALLDLYPGVASIALVPVGLTGHRQQLPSLRLQNKAEALAILALAEELQADCLERYQTRLLWPADEIFLQAERQIPDAAYYEDYPVLEDGVGMLRSFLADWQQLWANQHDLIAPRRVRLVTGISAAAMLQQVADLLNQTPELQVTVQPISNHFFGETVTVAGLITGRDILSQLSAEAGELVLIPSVMLRDAGDLFLDDIRPQEIVRKFAEAEIRIIEPTASALYHALFKKRSRRSKPASLKRRF